MSTERLWSTALDDFAVCLAQQERLLDEERYGDIDAFVPPQALGPLPEHLAERAGELAARSQALVARVEQTASATARQAALARHLSAVPGQGRPLYLDQMA